MMEPFDGMDAGRMPMVADPTGAAVALWQAKGHIRAAIATEPGSVSQTILRNAGLEFDGFQFGALFSEG